MVDKIKYVYSHIALGKIREMSKDIDLDLHQFKEEACYIIQELDRVLAKRELIPRRKWEEKK
jgi:hypothetical protein